jgi:DNA-binding transcriptional ArsR family regulator
MAGRKTPRGRVGGKGRAPGSTRAAASPEGPAKGPQKDIHRLTDLDQMKVLADPLRIRILELLCEERTTKQVAGILGQPPTRLYHHVAALERVGLIRLTRTRQSRGAVEKYYVAVAKAFSADPRLFSSGTPGQAREATQGVAMQVLENTSEDFRALLESGESPRALQEEGILSYLEVRGSPTEMKAIRARLMKIIATSTGCGKEAGRSASRTKPAPSGRPYRLTIAFFPLAGRSADEPG